jgi:NADPH:quinone reductase-like Zn-dependent oxidoreductase
MKAVVFPKYGSPDVLQLVEADIPVPKEGQVLIKVYAAGANPLDWHRMRGQPVLVRLSEGFFKPKNPKLGADVAGKVEAVGGNVTQITPGDEVFGVCTGGFAEYVLAGESKVALKPANLSFASVAAVPVAAFTALNGLRDKGKIQSGQKVLINGASGGVGTFAVQIAKLYGTDVTAVCSTRNIEMVRSIGADHVIDYTQEDFTRKAGQYDLIYDAVGNRSVLSYRRALSPGGICVITGFTSMSRLFEHMVLGGVISKLGGRQVGIQGVSKTPKEDLIVIKGLLEEEKVVPQIDKCYPLKNTAEAIRYLEAGRARGKVVIIVEEQTSNGSSVNRERMSSSGGC